MNVPKIRFKDFNDDYIRKNLKDVFSFHRGNTLSKADLAENGNNKCILYGELYTKYSAIANTIYSRTNNNNKNLVYGKKYDVLIPCSGETALDISTTTCLQDDNVIIGGDLTILRPLTDFGNYLSYYLYHKKKIEIAKYAQGDSVVHLYADKIKNLSLNLPTYEEQKKVSQVLELLDKKIELQTKKIEDLKLFKLCMMKEIFTSNSASNLTKIKDIAIIEKGKQINGDLLLEYGNYYMLNGGINPSGYLNEYNRNENTITISEGGNSCGYVNINKEKFWCGGHCYSAAPNNINNDYLYQILKYNEKAIMELRVGSGLPNIQKKDIENFNLKIHNKEEQENIALKLSKFDYKITLEEKYLSKLHDLKKGLMQNMFV